MIFTGHAFKETNKFNYSKETIENARTAIKKYPTLYSIVGDFDKANKKNYGANHFLMLATRSVSNPFMGGKPDKEAEKALEAYESLVSDIIPKLSKITKNKLISRLKDFGENHSATILELDFFIELIQNPSVSNIEYENPKRGTHDFYFKIQDTEFNLDSTGLGKGEIQKILEDAFEKTAEVILEQIKENTLLKLDVITDAVLKINGENDSNEIKKYLTESFESIKPIVFVVRNNYCILEKNLSNPEKSLYDFRELFRYYNEFGERLLKLLDSQEGCAYLKKIKVKEIQQSPFSSFIIGDARTKLVEIHSKSVWPSKAEELRKKSLLKQFEKRVVEKISSKQLAGKSNPLLAVNFYDTLFHDYTSDSDLFGREHFQELKTIVDNIFKEIKETEVLGILLYEGTIKRSKFISNPNIVIPDDILSKIKLLNNDSSLRNNA